MHPEQNALPARNAQCQLHAENHPSGTVQKNTEHRGNHSAGFSALCQFSCFQPLVSLYLNLVIKFNNRVEWKTLLAPGTGELQKCRQGFRARDPLTVRTRSRADHEVWAEQ